MRKLNAKNRRKTIDIIARFFYPPHVDEKEVKKRGEKQK